MAKLTVRIAGVTVTLMSDTAIDLSWVLVRKAAGLLTPGLDGCSLC
jgi:hypothetical protein